MRAPQWAVPAAVLLLAAALAGCTAGTDDPVDAVPGLAEGAPRLYLNVTVGNETHRFVSPGATSGDPHGGHAGNGTLNASASATSSSGTVTAQGNATGGNGTAQGNATASNGTGSAQGSAGGAGEGAGGMGGVPSGDAPMDVTVEIGASGLPEVEAGEAITWSIDWGDAAETSGGNGSAGAYGNSSAAAQQARETGTQLPMRLQHTYPSAGQYDLTFVVQAATEKLGTLSTPIAVAQGGPLAGTPLGALPFNATGDFPPSLPIGCGEDSGEDFPWPLPADFNGTPAQVSNLTLDLATSGTVYEADLHLVAPNGTVLASGDGNGPDKSLMLEGPLAAGEYIVRVVGCGAAEGSFDVAGAASFVATGTKGTT